MAELAMEGLVRRITEAAAAQLGIDPRTIDPDDPFSRYGLDSVGAIALIKQLAEALRREISPVAIWRHPTPRALAEHLAADPSAIAAPAVQAVPGAPDAPGRPASSADEPIAIVGMACRFPGAPSLDAFWRLLCDGVDAIRPVPPERWDAAAWGEGGARWGGFLDHVDRFDPLFFAISPREAITMDPQQRLVLELAWEALEHAGIVPGTLKSSATGVYVGSAWVDYARLVYQHGAPSITPHTVTGHHRSILANRVSYVLGLVGPSLAVDSACSSGLLAVHLACDGLLRGDADVALAGAVNLNLLPESTHGMTRFGALSPDGRCFTFDARANGYVRGEGGAVVVLKRLSRALADGDPIVCVIRGSAVNNDGPSNGLTAPSPVAQEAVLRAAYRRAQLAPDDVQYVELHGTGTQLGDPIEASALGAVLGAPRTAGPLFVGSAKTNVGHLEAAAGMVGLVKVALCIHHRRLVPSLHFATPNPHIPFDALKLQVACEAAPWPRPDRPLVAGVSSFGMGGTNAHVVVAEWPSPPVAILPLAAEGADALYAAAQRWRDAVASDPGAPLAPPPGPRAGGHRLALTARSSGELMRGLDDFLTGTASPRVATGAPAAPPKLVFVFAGQGLHWLGMGRSLLAREPVFRDQLLLCAARIERRQGWSLVDELTADPARARLDHVEIGWPASLAIQIALDTLWRSWGVEPAAVIGHSGGEIAAAYAGGALDLDDAIATTCAYADMLARVRGQGAMGVVGLPWDAAAAALAGYDGRLFRAIEHAADTTVVAGEPAALDELLRTLAHEGTFCRRLAVDVAPHCPQVAHLRGELGDALAAIRPRPSAIPIASASRGAILPGERFDPPHWVRNFSEPLAFATAIDALIDAGHDAFLEISPHPGTLHAIQTNLRRRGLARPGALLPSLRRDEDEHGVLLHALATLYALGAPVRWAEVRAAIARAAPPAPSNARGEIAASMNAPGDIRDEVAASINTHHEVVASINARDEIAASINTHHEVVASINTVGDVRGELAVSINTLGGVRGEITTDPRTVPGMPVPVPLSGRTEAALRAQAEALAGHLAAHPQLRLVDLAYALATTRTQLEHRAAILAADRDELLAGLSAIAQGDAAPEIARADVQGDGKRVFVFPGQGTQWTGMARPLLATSAVFRAAIAACAEALAPHTDWDLHAVLRGEPGAPSLDRVDVVQPVLFAVMVALAAQWRDLGVVPDAVIGHSQGEIAAACVAGALSLEDAARVAARRSRALAALRGRGTMALVELPAEELAPRLLAGGGRLAVAAINGPHATVVSGAVDAIDALLGALERDQVFARKIRVDYASHSPDVEAIHDELAEALAGIRPTASAIPMISTVTGQPIDGAALDAGYWYRNLRQTVRFLDAVRGAIAAGHAFFVEVSPHPVLTLAIQDALAAAARAGAVVGSLRRDAGDLRSLLGAAAELHVRGATLDWRRLVPAGRRVPLPTYAFQRERYWLEPPRGPRRRAEVRGLFGAPVVSSLDDGVRLWDATVSAETVPYLADHVVDDRMIFPGVAYAAMVIDAVQGRLSRPAIEDVELHAALDASPPAVRAVQLAVVARGPDTAFRISSREERSGDADAPGGDAPSGWVVHATGVVREAGEPPAPRDDLAAIQARCTHHIAGTAHYAALRAWRLAYGPGFAGITAVWRGRDEALAAVAVPALGAGEAVHRIDPRWLDAALQVALALDPRYPAEHPGAAVVPVGWRALRIHDLPRAIGEARSRGVGTPTALPAGRGSSPVGSIDPRRGNGHPAPVSEALWSHARLAAHAADDPARHSAGAAILTVDVTIMDAAGHVVIEAEGLRLQRLERSVDRERVLRLTWQAAARTSEPAAVHAGNGHAGNGHAGNGHVGNSHASNGHAGNGHAGNSHASNGHAGNSHAGNSHAGNSHAGNSHAGNSHASDRPSGDHWILVGRGELADGVRAHLEARGQTVASIDPGDLAAADATAHAQLRAHVPDDRACRGVVHLAAASAVLSDDDDSAVAAGEPVWASALHLVQALTRQGWRDAPRLWLVTRGVHTPGATASTATAGLLAEAERSPGHRAKPEAPEQRSEGSAETDVRGDRMKYGLLAGAERSPGHRAKPEAPEQRSEGSAETDVRGDRMKYGLLGAPLLGFGRTVVYEHPELRCTRLDLPGEPSPDDAERLAGELLAPPGDDEIALRGEQRFVARLAAGPIAPRTPPAALPAPPDPRAVSGRLATGTRPLYVRPAPAAAPTGGPGFRADASYLLTGGFGGLGLALARWLVDRGARRLVLAGRGGPGDDARAALHALEARGAVVVEASADVARRADVAALIHAADELAPLAGVFHLAGVLDDALVTQQDRARFRRVMAPKIDGAWHLHQLTRRHALDHFVLYSSIASLLGSPGQTNYAAANSFLDALALHRRALGLPAQSIGWGPFAGVGLAAAREVRGERLQDRGMASLSTEAGGAILAALVAQGEPWAGVVALDVARWLDFYPTLAGSALFDALISSAPAAAPIGEAHRALVDKLRAAPPPLRLAQLEAVVRHQLARVLQCRPEAIAAHAAFTALGLESLTGLELRNRIEAETGLRLPATLIWTRGNLASLARDLLDRLFPPDAAPPAPSAPLPIESSIESPIDTELRDHAHALTEDELLAELASVLDEAEAS